jgi:hypothetical protein
MKYKALVGLLLLAAASTSFGSASQAGAIFLLIFPGARPNGMGATFCSISDDAMAIYYNPAGAAFQENANVSLMHASWLKGLYPDMYYEYLGVVKPVEGLGHIGFNIIYLTTGVTEGMDRYGTPIARWRTFDFAAAVTYSTKVRPNLAFGGGIKFIYSYLAPGWLVTQLFHTQGGGQGSSFALDLALLYKMTDKLSVGVALQNLGPNIRYLEGGASDPLPRTLKIGASYKLLNSNTNTLTLASDVTKVLVALESPFDLNYELWEAWKHFGVEYWYRKFFSARAGYFIDREGHREGPTFGGGVSFKGFQFDIGVDSELYEFDTENYRFSLTYTF